MKTAKYGGISKAYTCPVCKRYFLVPYQTKGGGHTKWVYKLTDRTNRKLLYYCSYHCFDKAKKENEGYDGSNS